MDRCIRWKVSIATSTMQTNACISSGCDDSDWALGSRRLVYMSYLDPERTVVGRATANKSKDCNSNDDSASFFPSKATMKLLALAMSMALSLTAAQLTELYCDYGSGGNGDCERDGKYTYCVSAVHKAV
ncbi:hypothetical protein CLAFUW4_06399 [Fulvia fulva]|uniref:Uncharacterized protein n=1 Tax=Passalora fulva TaxID=5499 RepID=A0A9Q8LIW0_PASFU|nr:uncharacterized protein CLAFUR5_06543 [Fulvia fulva]KAK4624308.1 hypothetical protein CLAFUR4_06402 [Fulvia fulva]KAK4626013.1 hypothetical protein CLAFUR0_06403 [Fulvia fulva]UJO18221.1 hypothetical protein CLAFUR5_06543 [Fulvia fulva]WPV15300.1 hypothetical protein CLAFUW4_06399 [Fulvia fulva]WPV29753.1 hypothetical protein CLAFUW7_06397 [Fulvia fulva]